MKLIFINIILGIFLASVAIGNEENSEYADKPKLCLTFDDYWCHDSGHWDCIEINEMLLNILKNNNLRAAAFVTCGNVNDSLGRERVKSWDEAGHLICNHTFTHPNLSSKKVSADDYAADFLRCDSVLKDYENYSKIFRYTYLKEGDNETERDLFRSFLKSHEFSIGYVTIDDSDWYINKRLIDKLKENPDSDVSAYGDYYVRHIVRNAKRYNDLAVEVTGRQINHSLLLHYNLLNALFLADVIDALRQEGWEIISADEAFKDEIYQSMPEVFPSGESLILSLAKEKGIESETIRYPGESAEYEKEAMDLLGL